MTEFNPAPTVRDRLRSINSRSYAHEFPRARDLIAYARKRQHVAAAKARSITPSREQTLTFFWS